MLSLLALHFPLEGLFFVSDRSLKSTDSLLSLLLVLLQLVKDLLQLHLGLNSLLNGFAVLLGLIECNVIL